MITHNIEIGLIGGTVIKFDIEETGAHEVTRLTTFIKAVRNDHQVSFKDVTIITDKICYYKVTTNN